MEPFDKLATEVQLRILAGKQKEIIKGMKNKFTKVIIEKSENRDLDYLTKR